MVDMVEVAIRLVVIEVTTGKDGAKKFVEEIFAPPDKGQVPETTEVQGEFVAGWRRTSE